MRQKNVTQRNSLEQVFNWMLESIALSNRRVVYRWNTLSNTCVKSIADAGGVIKLSPI